VKAMYKEVEKPDFIGKRHNARDDAIFQAYHLMRILRHKAVTP
jgi:hypothetical protein